MSKKLKRIALLGLTTVMFLMPTIQASAEETYTQADQYTTNEHIDSKEIVFIKNSIYTYFDGEFKSIIEEKAVNQDNVICNNKLKELKLLQHTREALWYKALDDVISDYKIDITYKSIDLYGDTCTVNLLKDTSFSFTKSPDINSQEFDNEHIITLKKINNIWLIENDIDVQINEENSQSQVKANETNLKKSKIKDTYNIGNRITDYSLDQSTLKEYNQNMDNQISSLKESISDIDNEIDDYKELRTKNIANTKKLKNSNSIRANSLTSWNEYDWNAAVNYARGWAYGFNPSYPNFDKSGGDCTNFVSQAIYAGAPAMNFDSRWYISSVIYGKPWTCVGDFWNFIINNRGAGPVSVDNTKYLDICMGDPVQLWNNSAGGYTHTVIVTANDGQGGLAFSSHTVARRDYSFDSLYAKGIYNYDRERTAHILGYNK